MSQKAVERAIGKLATDTGFRREFLRAPGASSLRAGLDLTPDELDALARIPAEGLARFAALLDARICRFCFSTAADAREAS
jgi:hypothetical protein